MFDYIFLSYCFLSENQVRLPRFVSIYERDNPTYTRNFANVSRASIIKLRPRLILNRIQCLFSIGKSFAEHLQEYIWK